MEALEPILHRTLTAFGRSILDTPWYGLEREAVSWYAFGFLVKACRPGALLHDPGHLAIAGRMPATRSHTKARVCKDLVIWPRPGPPRAHAPDRAGVESRPRHLHPRRPAQAAGVHHRLPGLLGIVVTFSAKRRQVLRAAKVWQGQVEEGWLEVC
ncbi:MAG: hypothetical protein H6594_06420 [Flavobacteriales bacterium]|nr:hypothetical protein [Flavobacteriales bacterium]